MWAVGLVVVALAVVYFSRWIHKSRNPKSNGVLPPGSMGLPLIGEIIQLATPSYSLDVHHFVKTRVAKYGPTFKTSILGKPAVVTADSEFITYIVQQEGRSVQAWSLDGLSKMFLPETDLLLTSAMIHRYMRNITLNQFGSESLKEHLLPVIEATVNSTLDSWASLPSVEVKDASTMMGFNVSAKRMFGYDTNKSPTKIRENYINMLSGMPSFPLPIPGTKFHKCLKYMEAIQEVLKATLQERRSSVPETGRGDFLDQALKDMSKENFFSEELIVKLVFVVSVISMESISTTLTLMLNFLSENPHVLDQLTSEHEAILKARQNPNSTLTWEEYKSMTFTMQVINESLRIGSVAPFVVRKAAKEINFNGYTIPEGWTVMLATPCLHLNPKTFKDPLTFNPWRWQELDSTTISKNFMPYGGGTRHCAGSEYAKAFLSTFLHVLVTKYGWTKLKGGTTSRGFIFRFVDGLHIKVKHRQ